MPKIPTGQSDSSRVTFCQTCGREVPWQAGRCPACGAKRIAPGLAATLNEAEQLRDRVEGLDPASAEVRRAARRALYAWDRFAVSLVVLAALGLLLGVALNDATVGWSIGGFVLAMAMIRDAIVSALRARDREARVLQGAGGREPTARP